MKKPRLLQFGENGQVGRELKRAAANRGVEIETLGHGRADFSRPETVARAVSETEADLVINATGYTAVDRAEAEEGLATTINGEAVGVMAKACAARDLPLIHISTDYVFGGDGHRPYAENDFPAPINAYGRSKLAGEQAIASAGGPHVILRTSWVYSAHGNNFVKTMLRLGAEKESISVVCDQRGCPTAASDIAAAILQIAARIEAGPSEDSYGVFHFSGAGETSWYEFAAMIFEQAKAHGDRTPRLTPISTEQYPTPAARPRYSVLNCEKIERVHNIRATPWAFSLRHVLGDLWGSTEKVAP